jgi:inorganic phosphate transporter, PiT family
VTPIAGLVIVVGVAFGLTSQFNRLRIPTSTIQILVFSVVGAGLAANVGIQWRHISELAAIWLCAPIFAAGAGYGLTKLLDLVPATRVGATPIGPDLAGAPALTGVGATETTSIPVRGAAPPATAGRGLAVSLAGGFGLAAGVLTRGRPLLRRVAFDIVTVDRPMATAAQLVQATEVLSAVTLGFFTSMNQALVGAMTGAGMARDRRSVPASIFFGILRGWVIEPGAGIALAYGATRSASALAGGHYLLARS